MLDNYEDIFSDFDPRPFSVRGLSEDFLAEMKKAIVETKEGALELRFLIPKQERNLEHEALIKKRLHEHFRKHHALLEAGKKKSVREGAVLSIVGMLILLTAAYIVSLETKSLTSQLVLVILEPSGWFTTWSGLEMLFFRSKEKDAEIDFNARLSKAEISFMEF